MKASDERAQRQKTQDHKSDVEPEKLLPKQMRSANVKRLKRSKIRQEAERLIVQTCNSFLSSVYTMRVNEQTNEKKSVQIEKHKRILQPTERNLNLNDVADKKQHTRGSVDLMKGGRKR